MRKVNPQDEIDSYRRKQQTLPFIVGGLAVLLVVGGVIFFAVWYTSNPSGSPLDMFASATPTFTETPTFTPETPTLTPSLTSTETMTATASETATPSGPFEYTVQEKDNCWDLASRYNVGLDVLQAINNFGSGCPIAPGQKILIPAPGQTLPTETPLPTDIARGTKIEYVIKLGDSLASIASKFNSTVEQIKKDNKIVDENAIEAGTKLTIKVNLVTPTKTQAPTSTPVPTDATAAALTPQAAATTAVPVVNPTP